MKKRKMNKMKYEKPVVLDLGEKARGVGTCSDGSGDVQVCSNTGINTVHGGCVSGTNPTW